MAKNNNLTDFLTNTANAIRTAEGSTGTINPQDFESKIIALKLSTKTADATVTAAKMLSGKTAYVNGSKVTGNIATKTSSNLSASGATVTAPAGYYASSASKSVATATQATPSISVDSAGLINASATQTAGYVSAGTKSATKQLTVQAAQTITPGTSNKTIASSTYLTGTQTIKGDSNLVAENIKSGVSIFGVTGTQTGGGSQGGKVWTKSNITGSIYLSKILYANGLWMVSNGYAREGNSSVYSYYSFDGKTWVQNNFNYCVYNLYYFKNYWFITTSNGVGYSTNGTSWSFYSSYTHYDLVPGCEYIVGHVGNTIHYSSDCITWTSKTDSNCSLYNPETMIFIDGYWVRSTSSYAYRPNGTWSSAAMGNDGGENIIGYDIDSGLIVSGGQNVGIYYMSTRNMNWTQSNITSLYGDPFMIKCVNGRWYLSTNSSPGQFFTSTDGKIWSECTIDTYSTIISVEYGNGVWVAVVAGGSYYSTDGVTFTKCNGEGYSGAIISYDYIPFIFNDKIWVNSQFAYSIDGITWEKSNIFGKRTYPGGSSSSRYNNIRYENGIWVGIGTDFAIYYSED